MKSTGQARVETLPSPGRPSLTGRASLNALASGLDYGVRAVVELIVSPLIVSGLGAAAFGAWRVLWQWSSYVWGASGRSAQALQFAIANRQRTATDEERRGLVGAAIAVWLIFLPLLLTAGGLGVYFAPLLLDVPADQVAQVRWAAAILVLDSMAITLLTLPRSVLVGQNLGYTRMGVSAVLVAVGGVLLVLAVTWDLGLPGLAGATLVTSVLTGVVFWRITRRRVTWFGAKRPGRAVTRWFLRLSLWFLGWKFVLELMIASDVLVLALFAPLAVVAAFALTKWVADALAQVMGLLVQATIPGIGGYLGAGDLAKAAALRGEVLSLVWLVATAAGTTVIAWNGTFVGLWVGADLYAGRTTTLLVVVLALQLALIKSDTFILDVALIPRVKVVAGSVAAVASIGFAALALGPLDAGVPGLCLGLVAGRAILGIAAPVALARFLQQPAGGQLRHLLRPAVVTAGFFGAAWWLAARNAAESWWALLPGVPITVAGVAGLALVLGLAPARRRLLVARGRHLAARVGSRR